MLEYYISGDIVILNRESVGNPQSCHKDCHILAKRRLRTIFFIGPGYNHNYYTYISANENRNSWREKRLILHVQLSRFTFSVLRNMQLSLRHRQKLSISPVNWAAKSNSLHLFHQVFWIIENYDSLAPRITQFSLRPGWELLNSQLKMHNDTWYLSKNSTTTVFEAKRQKGGGGTQCP